MSIKKLKKVLSVFLLGITMFFINNGVANAAQKEFPNYPTNQEIRREFCAYAIVGSNYYKDKTIYLTYDGNTIKYINPKDGSLKKGGYAWDTEGVNQKIEFSSKNLTNYLVTNGELDCTKTLYFSESSFGNLEITTSYNSNSLGESAGILVNGVTTEDSKEKSNEIDTHLNTDIIECPVDGMICQNGDGCRGDGEASQKDADINVIYDTYDGSIVANVKLGEYDKVNISSDVTKDLFKSGTCPALYAQCSPGSRNCTLSHKKIGCSITQDDVCYGEEQVDPNNIKGDEPNTNISGSECAVIGEKTREDISNILNYVRIIVPILVIVLGTVDFAKAVLSDDEKALNKATSTLVKRMIIAVAVFFAPIIIMYILDLANKLANLGGKCKQIDVRELIIWKK